MDSETNIHELKEKVRKFCDERDWDQYHPPKELAIALIIEAGELLEHFRWKSEKESKLLLEDKKNVVLFATARRVATELNELRSKGLLIFDVQKIREFICYKKEMLPIPEKDSQK